MILVARSVGFIVLGFILGAATVGAWLGRYHTEANAGGTLPFAFAIRTDRFTGKVDCAWFNPRDGWRPQETVIAP